MTSGVYHPIATIFRPLNFVLRAWFNLFYVAVQRLIVFLFAPPAPPRANLPKHPSGRIAVIGAGLTGVSSAAHAIAHGFDVIIYEQDDRVGGIWAHVNATSGLQLNSMLYRFHPAVIWTRPFPKRDEILSEISRIWKLYKLEPRTRFSTRVTSIRRASTEDHTPSENETPAEGGHARWIVNNGEDGIFDAVIVTVGTCGEPQKVQFPGMPKEGSDSPKQDVNGVPDEKASSGEEDDENEEQEAEETFEGLVVHSSELDDVDLEGKKVVVIGSGASGVEAVETALDRGAKGARSGEKGDGVIMLARDDKWIIPRNFVLDTLISAQPFGREMPLSFIPEQILKMFHYHGVSDLAPTHTGLFESTPIVNDTFLDHVRTRRCAYLRGDTIRLTKGGVRVNLRERGTKPGDEGEEKELAADVVVLATGFKRPDVGFLEKPLFPEGYDRPNLYLQNFATEDWSVLMTNSAYQNAIGTVGHFHIGIYTRILLTFLLDPDSRPTPKDMKLWVDVLRFVKRGAKGGALGFFTYMELTIWLLVFHIFRLDRIKWMFFIMQGWGVYPEEYKQVRKGIKGKVNEQVEKTRPLRVGDIVLE